MFGAVQADPVEDSRNGQSRSFDYDSYDSTGQQVVDMTPRVLVQPEIAVIGVAAGRPGSEADPNWQRSRGGCDVVSTLSDRSGCPGN